MLQVAIWIGLGDNTTNQFRAIAYGHDYVYVYSDQTFPVDDQHPRYPYAVIDQHMIDKVRR